MALNIKDPETDALARALARETGETITEAVKLAMAERLARIRGRQRRATRPDLARFIERGRNRAILDARTPEEILGYDADGLPR
ncbi:MAG: type II toxin-antitoxin system VapB family antitoxin [Propionibacteriaceae bacterium]|nr:type II toxin-antitoxin system VapB family antitoxin [Propionibacteriaceae bacterium]